MIFKGRDIISIKDFNKQELLRILEVADEIQDRKHYGLLKGRVLASLFFEPSTRTRLSFEAAMHKLRGNVIGFSEANVTSTAKGESLRDTIKIIGGYSNVIVIRHPEEGSAAIAANATDCPVINGGDGANQHPTQTFLDLFTILKEKGTLDGLNIGFLGDLKYGRTVHSLAYSMTHFNNKMFFISPESLRMPEECLKELKDKGVSFKEERNLMDIAPELDILYVTRIQKERFSFEKDFKKVQGSYKLDKGLLEVSKKDLKIMHPLPRVGEIVHELDDSSNAIYFQQANNGIPVRMALLALVLGKIE